MVAHLVHEAVEEDGGPFLVNTEFPLGSVVVILLDVLSTLGAAANAYHPQELIYICRQKDISADFKTAR